ncbi:N-acetylmuramic acid 6-phosphate etherase [Aestuariimicrobium sp. p3-SID1156]|uniref:N-acetylmuramic acid 6-phosphate etherase n=1 Tax=Aestuariimicrobium sp. p3-SID1156 TaxID=2916038 RepID=UPI00223B1E88|nr:N-acetylmuramic acid 6-phosphate etherase [Aestuariimicrobium sp. p3-SID1156]MCT1458230.1 N-acetylmuramic acid 6-phosphate etherase [Aestuariimicrobium sp. p3-SID1156]
MTNPEQLTWSTEQRSPDTVDIDTLPTAQVVERIVAADAAVHGAVEAVAADIARAADLVIACLSAGGTVHYVGSGTSGRMGILDAVELLPTYHVGSDQFQGHLAGGAGAMVKAVEGAEDDADSGAEVVSGAGDNDLIIGLAASGRTPYVRGALAAARERGLGTVLVSSNPNAPLAELADVAILPDTGPEVVTGSTRMKAATAQKVVLNTMSTAAMIRLGKTYSNLMIDMMPTNEKLKARSVRMLQQATDADPAACAAALEASGGEVRVALVSLLAGVEASVARDAVAANPTDAGRSEDPSGIRSAVEAARAAAGSVGSAT